MLANFVFSILYWRWQNEQIRSALSWIYKMAESAKLDGRISKFVLHCHESRSLFWWRKCLNIMTPTVKKNLNNTGSLIWTLHNFLNSDKCCSSVSEDIQVTMSKMSLSKSRKKDCWTKFAFRGIWGNIQVTMSKLVFYIKIENKGL